MYKRRGSTPPGESASAPLPPVHLDIFGDTILDWSTFSGPDPDQWQIWRDGVNDDSVPGTDREWPDVDAGHAWFVVGLAADLSPVTQHSNTVSS